MGRGSYTASDWNKLKASRGINETSTATTIFKNTTMKDYCNPRLINMRESCDSDDSPAATPIIIGFDVTGSMGYLAKELATNALNKTVTEIYRTKPVTDPHILCAAIGDVKCDKYPLQVTQFEADIRIVEQLLDLYLEGGGGSNGGESYHLLWYFAAHHTNTDAYNKRHQKGFLFTIGDDDTHTFLSSAEIDRVFGDKVRFQSNNPLIRAASEKYELFHIAITNARQWKNVLPGRVVTIQRNQISYLSDIIIAILEMSAGTKLQDILRRYDRKSAAVLAVALSDLALAQA